ncbi:imidazolonepropionase [Criibacterium bergeronii]|uniref:Imidazolonepropionase n=1 Tax=Criibacterium bergeronii TaxID=1871336 RepID=A0A371IKW1_9FIRM|nr:imidazolonepropionase [Criibacterium bergeronii]RDY21103.1 imidazolonepropionase [Criibacterium bergeronii]
MSKLIIKNASQIATPIGHSAKFGKEMNEVKVYENASIVVEDGKITKIGADALEGIDESGYEVIDAKGKAVLPGFVDSHTHFTFGGYRADEFSWRLRGDSYMDIMNRGGGIQSTVNATREASEDELFESGMQRLDSMLAFGVTSVEGKSGYGLDKNTELKQLRVMKKLNESHPIDITSTFLGAHAVPKEYKGRSNEYIDFLINEVLPEVVNGKLAEYFDVFTEKGVFDIEESRKMYTAAKNAGMKLKIHADEIVTLGGAELAAEFKMTSADHLLHASDEGLRKMAENKVISTLLPTTAFCIKEPYARARFMIEHGSAVALATDFNPGSGFTNSIPLMFALATIYMGMTPEEAITALTLNGAAAIDKAETVGSLEVGKNADIVILKFPSYNYLPYHTGVNIVEKVVKNGKLVRENK